MEDGRCLKRQFNSHVIPPLSRSNDVPPRAWPAFPRVAEAARNRPCPRKDASLLRSDVHDETLDIARELGSKGGCGQNETSTEMC